MTRVFERAIADGPVGRAFIIGVGAYPHAKPANATNSTPQKLRDVPDLQSAATGAALFCDWLISNADLLAAPLGSIDLLLNVTTNSGVISSYHWMERLTIPTGATDPRNGNSTVDDPTVANVKTTGVKWRTDLALGAQNLAIFYICGHGATLGGDNIVFLADLNSDDANPWGALLNIQTHASAFKVIPSIRTAFFFVDACSELVTDIVLVDPGVGAQFATSGGKLGEEKVTLLAAATAKRLSYEGGLFEQPDIKAGRFTQCVLQGLSGAAVRPPFNGVGWSVHGTSLFESLKPLYSLRLDWVDLPFEPGPPMLPADRYKIVEYASPPHIPFRVRFVPPRSVDWALEIQDHVNTQIVARPSGPPVDWNTRAPASLYPYTLTGVSTLETKTVTMMTCQSNYCYDL